MKAIVSWLNLCCGKSAQQQVSEIEVEEDESPSPTIKEDESSPSPPPKINIIPSNSIRALELKEEKSEKTPDEIQAEENKFGLMNLINVLSADNLSVSESNASYLSLP